MPAKLNRSTRRVLERNVAGPSGVFTVTPETKIRTENIDDDSESFGDLDSPIVNRTYFLADEGLPVLLFPLIAAPEEILDRYNLNVSSPREEVSGVLNYMLTDINAQQNALRLQELELQLIQNLTEPPKHHLLQSKINDIGLQLKKNQERLSELEKTGTLLCYKPSSPEMQQLTCSALKNIKVYEQLQRLMQCAMELPGSTQSMINKLLNETQQQQKSLETTQKLFTDYATGHLGLRAQRILKNLDGLLGFNATPLLSTPIDIVDKRYVKSIPINFENCNSVKNTTHCSNNCKAMADGMGAELISNSLTDVTPDQDECLGRQTHSGEIEDKTILLESCLRQIRKLEHEKYEFTSGFCRIVIANDHLNVLENVQILLNNIYKREPLLFCSVVIELIHLDLKHSQAEKLPSRFSIMSDQLTAPPSVDLQLTEKDDIDLTICNNFPCFVSDSVGKHNVSKLLSFFANLPLDDDEIQDSLSNAPNHLMEPCDTSMVGIQGVKLLRNTKNFTATNAGQQCKEKPVQENLTYSDDSPENSSGETTRYNSGTFKQIS